MPRSARMLVPALAPWWLAGLVVLTVVGFRRTIAAGPAGLDVAHAVHGTSALGWSLLLVAQAMLAERRRRTWHRQLAVVAVCCAVVLVASSLPMLSALAAAAEANVGFRPLGRRLLVMDVLLLGLFVALFAMAIAQVRRPEVHARAMAATGLIALPAGLGRAWMQWASVDPVTGSWLAVASGLAIIAAVIIVDRRAGVRDRVFPSVFAAFLLLVVLTERVADSRWVAEAASLLR